MSHIEDYYSEEDDKNELHTWNGISANAEITGYCTSILEDEVKQSLSDEENEAQSEDPLNDNDDKIDVKITNFQGEYNEADFIALNFNEDQKSRAYSVPSRRKKSKLSTEFESANGRIWSTDIITNKNNVPVDLHCSQLPPKIKGPATKAKNPLETWYLLLDDHIISIIVTNTNEKINSLKGKMSYQRRTDIVELRAWLGLNYLCGIFRNTTNRGPLNELWTWELGNSIFRATMSWKRFEFLATCISFSSPTRKKSSLQNVLLIQDVWERFLANCRSYYTPSGNCIIRDWNIDINDVNENARLAVLCDAKSMYVCNTLISNQMETKEARERVVLHLITDIKGSHRNVVLSEQYTSVEIGEKLKKRQLTLIGALSNESDDLPQSFGKLESNIKLYSEIGCLISETVGKTSSFLLINRCPGKVAVERLYKCTNQSWQHFEELIDAFSTKTASSETFNNGPLNLFYRLLDFAVFNAWILLQLSISGIAAAPTQREFQRDLGLYLTQMQLKRQLQDKSKLTLTQKLQISEVLGEPTDKLLTSACEKAKKNSAQGFVASDKLDLPEGLVLMTKNLERRKRCSICIKYQTRTRCQQCLRALCHRHLIIRCNDCMGVTELSDS